MSVPQLYCKKCQTPIPPYLYAVNYYTSAVIWVNGHAEKIPCSSCGGDVREGNMKVTPPNPSQ